jgi:hypothetical protein
MKDSKEMKMNANKTTARIVGALFLIAMVTSLVGGIWLESITAAPDYLVEASAQKTQVLVGVLLELVNCVAVIGRSTMKPWQLVTLARGWSRS